MFVRIEVNRSLTVIRIAGHQEIMSCLRGETIGVNIK